MLDLCRFYEWHRIMAAGWDNRPFTALKPGLAALVHVRRPRGVCADVHRPLL
jgi:hypothetical protein